MLPDDVGAPPCQTGLTVKRFEMPVRGGHERPWLVECWVSDDRLTILPVTIVTPNIRWGLPEIVPDHMPSRGSGWIAGEPVPMTWRRAMELQAVYLGRYEHSTEVLMHWQDTVGAQITRAFLAGRGAAGTRSRGTPEPEVLRLR